MLKAPWQNDALAIVLNCYKIAPLYGTFVLQCTFMQLCSNSASKSIFKTVKSYILKSLVHFTSSFPFMQCAIVTTAALASHIAQMQTRRRKNFLARTWLHSAMHRQLRPLRPAAPVAPKRRIAKPRRLDKVRVIALCHFSPISMNLNKTWLKLALKCTDFRFSIQFKRFCIESKGRPFGLKRPSARWMH